MDKQIYEIVKEFEANVDGLEHKIKGKILKEQLDNDVLFHGILSHYCKPNEDSVDIYIPSLSSKDINIVEHRLFEYLLGFTKLSVTVNNRY